MAGIQDMMKEVLKQNQGVLACPSKERESIERITALHKGCEQETERLPTLLTDSYSHYSRITYLGRR